MSLRVAAARLAVAAVLSCGWLIAVAGPAAAHPALISSAPGAG